MAQGLEMKAERGEVMAEHVMELARDSQALVESARFGEQRPGGTQLGIQPTLLLPASL